MSTPAAGPATDPATEPVAEPAGAVWCDRCGGALAGGGHAACVAARRLEPPRYCPQCRRRMKVQVVPAGWTASCVAHGARHS